MAFLREFRSIALLALFLITIAVPGIVGVGAQGGTGSIQGTVTGPAGGVVTNVKVTVEGTNLATQTDGTGDYRLSTVPPGEHTIVFDYLGLQTASIVVTVATGQAVTQDMTLAYGGEIEVRGSPLLVGQAKALNRQKNAINISNIVAADQIGRFPDKNASEATQRIPGVSLLRDQGEGRYVMVRPDSTRRLSTASASRHPRTVNETSPSTRFLRIFWSRSRSRRP
jgi:hypothetical protein